MAKVGGAAGTAPSSVTVCRGLHHHHCHHPHHHHRHCHHHRHHHHHRRHCHYQSHRHHCHQLMPKIKLNIDRGIYQKFDVCGNVPYQKTHALKYSSENIFLALAPQPSIFYSRLPKNGFYLDSKVKKDNCSKF